MRRVLFILLAAIALAGSSALVWSYLPPARVARAVDFPPDLAARYGANTIVLDFPSRLRLGEAGQFLARIKPVAGDQGAGAAQTGGLTYQARLALPRVNIRPDELQSDPYDAPRGSELAWQLTPFTTGFFEGTLRIYAQTGTGLSPIEEGDLIFALPLSLEVQPVLGLTLGSFRFAIAASAALALTGLLVLIVSRKTAV